MELRGRKRKRVHTPEPSTALVAAVFSPAYLAHLLPALAKIENLGSRPGHEDNDDDAAADAVIRTVRLQVNMALAASAGGFAWSRALRRGLERGPDHRRAPLIFVPRGPAPAPGRPPPPSTPKRPAKPRRRARRSGPGTTRAAPRNDGKLRDRIRTLRRILPGGNAMGVDELLCEVGSYVICLELQVNALRSLLGGAR